MAGQKAAHNAVIREIKTKLEKLSVKGAGKPEPSPDSSESC
ncbi:hypothetical protein LCGC14_1709590 [marine sediment metagenome]|uniref:Uncharacterized protein n=1 Tax=marine sediment metagenome TaxID=412755 RepID=A0A0F9I367_9ZZZZ